MSDPMTQAEWLLSIANSPGDDPKMIAFGELVQRGLADIQDLAELRSAGMKVYEIAEVPQFKVWIEAREFIAAAKVVAAQRDVAEAPGRAH